MMLEKMAVKKLIQEICEPEKSWNKWIVNALEFTQQGGSSNIMLGTFFWRENKIFHIVLGSMERRIG